MRTRTGPNGSADKHVKEIKRKTRRKFSAEEKIRIVLDGLRGESSISELCRREGIAESLYYNWSKDFMEAGKKRLAGDTARQATSSEVTSLKREARDLKEVVAEQTLADAGEIARFWWVLAKNLAIHDTLETGMKAPCHTLTGKSQATSYPQGPRQSYP